MHLFDICKKIWKKEKDASQFSPLLSETKKHYTLTHTSTVKETEAEVIIFTQVSVELTALKLR